MQRNTSLLEAITVLLTLGSRTKLTWLGLGSNLGIRGERPANDRLWHGTVLVRFEREGEGEDREGPLRR